MKDQTLEPNLETLDNPVQEAVRYVALGKQLQNEHKFRLAEKYYRQAISKNNHLWEAYECLADLLAINNRKKAVLAVYRQGIQNNPQSPRYFLALAKALVAQKRWRNASVCYQQALKLDTEAPWGYFNWAKVLVELKEWDKAQVATVKAIQLKPDWWEAYHHLGKIFQHQHQWQSAISAYQKVIQLNPEFIHAYMRLAGVYRSLKQYEYAIDCYSYVIQNAVEKSPVQEQALAYYAATLEEHPNPTAKQYCDLGAMYRAQSYFPEAIGAYQEAIRIEPQFQLSYIMIQYTPLGEKQLNQLIDFYRQLVTENKHIYLAWGNLGDALSQQDKITEAIECYRTSCYQRVTNFDPQLIQLDWQKPKQNAPDFIIAGSSKCGTSSLYNYLSCHPQILLSHKKELDFFWQNFDKGLDWYLAHFPTITDRNDFLTGEATPNYLRFPLVAKRIKETCPDTKLIVLLRNPVERAISWHYHKVNSGLATGSLEDAISREMEELKTFDETQFMQGGYRKIDNIFSSLYYYQFKVWLEYLPREQFLILKSEDFYSNTATVMELVYDFLNVYPQKLKKYHQINVGSYQEADSAIRETLAAYFQPYNQKLEELLGLKFNWY